MDNDLAIYQFKLTDSEVRFYTASEKEKDSLTNNLDQYTYEGEAFLGAPQPESEFSIVGITPVYRFLNANTGTHLYTSSHAEKDFINDNLSNFVLEGTGFYAYDTPQNGLIPVYRLYNPSVGTHFFTPSAEEKNELLDSSGYQLEGSEGIAFYVKPTDV